jgi:hypothetical protein
MINIKRRCELDVRSGVFAAPQARYRQPNEEMR